MELHAIVKHIVAKIDVFVPDSSSAKTLVRFVIGVSDGDALFIVRMDEEEWGWFGPCVTVFHGIMFTGCVEKRETMLANLASSDLAHGGS
jgi:hypothetical protein